MSFNEHRDSFLQETPDSPHTTPGGVDEPPAHASAMQTDHTDAAQSRTGASGGERDGLAGSGTTVGLTGQPLASSYESYHPPVQQIPVKPLIGIGAGLIALVIFGIGWNMTRGPEKPKPRVQHQSIWSEQQQLAREAMQMAREAQQMQREHMEEMRRAMEGEYSGYYETTEDDW